MPGDYKKICVYLYKYNLEKLMDIWINKPNIQVRPETLHHQSCYSLSLEMDKKKHCYQPDIRANKPDIQIRAETVHDRGLPIVHGGRRRYGRVRQQGGPTHRQVKQLEM